MAQREKRLILVGRNFFQVGTEKDVSIYAGTIAIGSVLLDQEHFRVYRTLQTDPDICIEEVPLDDGSYESFRAQLDSGDPLNFPKACGELREWRRRNIWLGGADASLFRPKE